MWFVFKYFRFLLHMAEITIILSYCLTIQTLFEHVKHEAYVQKRKYLCSFMAAIEKQQHTHTLTHT